MRGGTSHRSFEMIHFCAKRDGHVVGGLSKLLKAFIRDQVPERTGGGRASRRAPGGSGGAERSDVKSSLGMRIEDVCHYSWRAWRHACGLTIAGWRSRDLTTSSRASTVTGVALQNLGMRWVSRLVCVCAYVRVSAHAGWRVCADSCARVGGVRARMHWGEPCVGGLRGREGWLLLRVCRVLYASLTRQGMLMASGVWRQCK